MLTIQLLLALYTSRESIGIGKNKSMEEIDIGFQRRMSIIY